MPDRTGGRQVLPGGSQGSGEGSDDPASAVQDVFSQLRDELLGGRGPGASAQETAPFMHDRPTIGAVPMVIERELVQVRTDLARGDVEAMQRDLVRARANLAQTLDVLVTRLAPRRLASGAIEFARARCALLLGAPVEQHVSASTLEGAQAGGVRGRRSVASSQDGHRVDGCGAVHEWWWPVAAGAAASGVATTLAFVQLARAIQRRRARRHRAQA